MDQEQAKIDNQKIELLFDVIQNIAAGEYDARIPVKNSEDPMDALGLGINMLAEEISVKVNELKRLNKLFIGRELKMIELKEEIKKLKAEQPTRLEEEPK